jgi:uncharacterized membrane protein YoaK (UPF0700 family)
MIVVALLLAALGGFVDAIAYLSLGGFFASFMSGNTTRLGIGLATGDRVEAATAGGLILAFLCGVMISTMLSFRFPMWRKAAVMLTVTMLLALTALLTGLTDRRLPLILLAVAMGAENGVFNREGDVSIGLTYMTGTLVRIGQRMTGALIGVAPRFGWVRHALLWSSFAMGVMIGAREYGRLGTNALWIAATAAAAMTVLVATLATRAQQSA